MIADTHQEGTLDVHRQARSVRFGGMAGWLIVGFAVASLFVALIWNHYEVRYPGVADQSTNQLQVTFQSQTADDLPKVLRWYTQHYALSHEVPQGENCVTLTGKDDYLFLQGSLTVTLCAQQKRTLIFVNRSLTVP